MAEPISEATSEELLDTKEPTEEPPLEIPKQKQPRRRRRRHQHLYRHRRGGCAHSFATYLSRVLKNVHQSLSLSQEAVSIMVSFMKDIFERIADEASLTRPRAYSATPSAPPMPPERSRRLCACSCLGELGKHTMSEATKATL
ncbi:PREDICTED: histone H2B type W-T-like [Hipposideros armiger]|uniref:Histone H2B type W-T-like n=1 Tax=Hipposideros armiger TaxID=186990 RepID=A0A8B7QK99_HIPAR|nr:PREDICTED: histone H2B type W-T-like [Hipposideros armiger]